MRSNNFFSTGSLAFFLSAVCLLAFSGCGGGDFAPVSGTVTNDGKPVPKLRVVFSPSPVGNNHAVGPFSMGVTDDQGKFTLETRHGDTGAVVGAHTLSCQYTDIGEDAMGELRDQLEDAKDDGDREEFEKAKKNIEKMQAKLKGRPVLSQRYTATLSVPEGGTDDLKIELSKMGGQ